MASTSIKIYAPRQLSGGVQWLGGNTCYQLIKNWAKDAVELDSAGDLYLQTADGVEKVPVGNHIMLDGGFHNVTPDDLEDNYAEIKTED